MKKNLFAIVFFSFLIFSINMLSSDGDTELVRVASDSDVSLYQTANASESCWQRYFCCKKESEATSEVDASLYANQMPKQKRCCCVQRWDEWKREVSQPKGREDCMYKCGACCGACATVSGYELATRLPAVASIDPALGITLGVLTLVMIVGCGSDCSNMQPWENLRESAISLEWYQKMNNRIRLTLRDNSSVQRVSDSVVSVSVAGASLPQPWAIDGDADEQLKAPSAASTDD